MSSSDPDEEPRPRTSTIERASNAFFDDDDDLFAPAPFEPPDPPRPPPAVEPQAPATPAAASQAEVHQQIAEAPTAAADNAAVPPQTAEVAPPNAEPPPAEPSAPPAATQPAASDDFLSRPLTSLSNPAPAATTQVPVAPPPAPPAPVVQELPPAPVEQEPPRAAVDESAQLEQVESLVPETAAAPPPDTPARVETQPAPEAAPAEAAADQSGARPTDDHRKSVVLEPEESGIEPLPPARPAGDLVISLSERLQDPAVIHIDEHRQPVASPLLQDYRRIKRPLLLNVRNNLATGRSTQGANIILVTSARPSEGKSTVATNLAISIATELDYYALLVDADVHSATVSRTMGVRDRLGLSDVLTRPEVSLRDTLVHTEWQNLSILPSGPEVNNIDELFASQSMYDLCSELWQRYEDRVIVVDSAPILVGGEPQILSRMVGQIVMVVEADTTPQHIVVDALGQLPNPDKVGFILNKASRNIGNQDYGYYRSVT